MRPALITPLRLLCGIAAFTVLCMLAVAAVTDHLANSYLNQSTVVASGRVHLINDVIQALKRVQDCRHGYIATGDPSYLDAYRTASIEVDMSMDRLVTEDNEITS